MDESFDENESVGEDLNEQPAAADSSSVDVLAPESESGEILQLLSYPENVVDQPESVKMLTVATQSKSKMEKYKKDFFNTVCCLVGFEIGDSPTTNSNDIYQRCMTIYGKLLKSNGAALLADTIGIFVHLPGTTIPKDVYQGRKFYPHEGENLLGNVPRHEKDSK